MGLPRPDSDDARPTLVLVTDFGDDFSPGSTELHLVEAILRSERTSLLTLNGRAVPERWKALASKSRSAGGVISGMYYLLTEIIAAPMAPLRVVTGGGWRALLVGAMARLAGARWLVMVWDSPLGARCDSKDGSVKPGVRLGLARRLLESADDVALFIHEGLLTELNVVNDRVRYIGNGVDAGALQAIALKASRGSAPVLCYVGLLSTTKGAEALFEAFALNRCSVGEATLLHVGSIKQEEQEEVLQMLRRLRIDDAVTFVGDLSFLEAMTKVATCHIGVMPYSDVHSLRWNEVLKAREYAALGLDVVGFALPGTVRALRGVPGVRLVPPGDVEGLARAMTESCRQISTQQRTSDANGVVAAGASWREREAELAEWIRGAASA